MWWDWASDSEYVIPVLVLRELPEVPKLGKGLNWALEEQEEGPCRPAERLLCGQAAVRRSRRVQRPQGVDGRPLHQSADSPAQPHTQATTHTSRFKSSWGVSVCGLGHTLPCGFLDPRPAVPNFGPSKSLPNPLPSQSRASSPATQPRAPQRPPYHTPCRASPLPPPPPPPLPSPPPAQTRPPPLLHSGGGFAPLRSPTTHPARDPLGLPRAPPARAPPRSWQPAAPEPGGRRQSAMTGRLLLVPASLQPPRGGGPLEQTSPHSPRGDGLLSRTGRRRAVRRHGACRVPVSQGAAAAVRGGSGGQPIAPGRTRGGAATNRARPPASPVLSLLES